MKFINREEELKFLSESVSLSRKKLFSIVMYGLRRVGKTRLLLEFIKQEDIYFFVNKDKDSSALLAEYVSVLKDRNIITELEKLDSWEQFFKVFFERYQGIAIFDEFQNFNQVDKSVFGILQKNIDIAENKKNNLLLIFSGSLIGLLKRLFMDKKEPLYERIKRQYFVRPLDFKHTYKFCHALDITNIEEAIKLFSVFGGFPKYYVSIEDEQLQGKSFDDIINALFFKDDAVLENEVQMILAQEFGKRGNVYYKLLEAIAQGSTTLSKIASHLNTKETSITRQIKELQDYFEIVGQDQAIAGKNNIYLINHPIIDFWFKFIYSDFSAYKRRDKKKIEEVKNDINSYIGRKFEIVCKEYLTAVNPINFMFIGRQWGKFNGEKGKNTYEIDLVALNEQTKDILFVECKWQSNVNAEQILAELKEKSKYVQWHNEDRKESFCIIAKSFKKKLDKKECLCFNLKDMEKTFNKK